jgi:CRP/FNR family transcriptional regulator, cyclic AMP receptor protein
MNLSLLRNTALFADLDEAQLGRVAEICHEQTYRSGETIFREGEPGNRLFIIVSGSVRISRDIPNAGEEALAVLKPGTCFGEMSVLDRSERSTDAIAADDCVLATISRPDLEMLLEFDKELAYVVLRSFVQMLSARLRATNDSLRTFLAMSMFG